MFGCRSPGHPRSSARPRCPDAARLRRWIRGSTSCGTDTPSCRIGCEGRGPKVLWKHSASASGCRWHPYSAPWLRREHRSPAPCVPSPTRRLPGCRTSDQWCPGSGSAPPPEPRAAQPPAQPPRLHDRHRSPAHRILSGSGTWSRARDASRLGSGNKTVVQAGRASHKDQ